MLGCVGLMEATVGTFEEAIEGVLGHRVTGYKKMGGLEERAREKLLELLDLHVLWPEGGGGGCTFEMTKLPKL